ncbi:MAG: protein-L-isoaspartate(D-aspartate) O-methyltransferase [Proteobacteria bacterium]|nr:protein-L-isoaspartate(D-aspartate) O-methyltransferase [Pseudomonadota bacterium]
MPHDPIQEQRRLNMVARLKNHGIKNQPLLKALTHIPRHLFVANSESHLAYEDSPLPIECHQTISQPFIVAYMIENANVHKEDTVLEIGTGSGYNAAVLSLLCREVYTIEIHPLLQKKAQALFKTLHYSNIHSKIADGAFGWPEAGLFDVIIVTAAADYIPQPLLQQLKPQGRLLMPFGSASQQTLIKITRTDQGFVKESLLPVQFVPLTRLPERNIAS